MCRTGTYRVPLVPLVSLESRQTLRAYNTKVSHSQPPPQLHHYSLSTWQFIFFQTGTFKQVWELYHYRFRTNTRQPVSIGNTLAQSLSSSSQDSPEVLAGLVVPSSLVVQCRHIHPFHPWDPGLLAVLGVPEALTPHGCHLLLGVPVVLAPPLSLGCPWSPSPLKNKDLTYKE